MAEHDAQGRSAAGYSCSFCPQLLQNLAVAGLSAPQLGHLIEPTAVPQLLQNLAPAGFTVPHLGQATPEAPWAGPAWVGCPPPRIASPSSLATTAPRPSPAPNPTPAPARPPSPPPPATAASPRARAALNWR